MMPLKGVLFFPVTAFGSDGSFNPDAQREHVRSGAAAGPGGVFAACGTGEFHTLSLDEYHAVVRATVEASGDLPVFAGVGGQIGSAVHQAKIAASNGAAGLLALPPYLVEAPGAGLVEYIRSIAAASPLPVIVYLRGTMRLSVADACDVAEIPTVVGMKDGIGNLDLISRIKLAVEQRLEPAGKEFQFFNGMPTAEASAIPYRAIGIRLYSSAVFCFAPDIALAFNRYLELDVTEGVQTLLRDFFTPYIELRSAQPGYAVSLVKAAVRTMTGIDTGDVRPPLVQPTPEELSRLEALIAGARETVQAFN